MSQWIMGEKIGQKFFSVERLPFFRKFVFLTSFRCYRNDLVTSKKNVKDFCRPLQIVQWGSSHSIMRERIGQNLFSAGRLPYFSENCVYNNLLGPKKWSYNFHSTCENTSWTIISCLLRYFTIDNARKRRPKSFLHWKVCFFFFKNLFFNNHLGVTEMIL